MAEPPIPILSIPAHSNHVITQLHLSPTRIITSSDDTTICIFSRDIGELVHHLKGHTGGVWSFGVEGDSLISGSTDKSIRVWNMESGRCTHVFRGHTSTVRGITIVRGKHLSEEQTQPFFISASRDSTMKLWKVPTPSEHPSAGDEGSLPPLEFDSETNNEYFIHTFSGHTGSVRCMVTQGDILVSGSYDKTVRSWSITTGKEVHCWREPEQKVYSVAIVPEIQRVFAGTMDNVIKCFSLDTGSNHSDLEGHSGLVGLLSSAEGEVLVSASSDGTVRRWDPRSTGQGDTVMEGGGGAITCLWHDQTRAIAGWQGGVTMWELKTGQKLRELMKDAQGVWAVESDGVQCVAAVLRDGRTMIEVVELQ